MFDRKQLKSESKELMRRGGGKVLSVVILFLIISFVFSYLTLRLEGADVIERQYRNLMESAQKVDASDPEAVQAYMESAADAEFIRPEVSFGARLIVFVLNLVSALLSMGFAWWCLKSTRGFIDKFPSIFDVFGNFGRAILLVLLKGVIITAGLLLLIIPGIYLALCYSQSEFILFENPDLGAVDCLRRSRLLMREHIGEFLMLNLSFAGWYILAGFAAGMVGSVMFIAGAKISTVTLVLIYIALIWLLPYTQFTMAGYYNYLTGYSPADPEQEQEAEE